MYVYFHTHTQNIKNDDVIVSLICSRIDYCNTVFAGIPNSTIDRFQSVLHTAARIITGVWKYDHITPTPRDELHWQRITFKLCLTVYKALHGMTPYIAEFCRPAAATHHRSRLRSATFGDLVVPLNSQEPGKRAFAVAGPTAWNNLPLSVTLAPSITTFKIALKTHLFSAACGASKQQWLAYASMITICFCKAPLRCLHLRRFINCQYYITLHYVTL